MHHVAAVPRASSHYPLVGGGMGKAGAITQPLHKRMNAWQIETNKNKQGIFVAPC